MTENKSTYNIALIGCGRIGARHAKILSELEGFKLVAVCDIIEENAKKFAEEYNCPFFLDYKEMLKEEKMDIVTICTPSGLHPEMTIEAAKAKKHVVTEKPMALKLKDADEMIKACKDHNVLLFVVKQNRFNPPIVALRKAIEAERFGKLFILNATVRWARPQSYYDMAPWRGTIKFDGGVLLNQASHHVDLIQWMGGPIESVFAKKKTMNHNIEVEDTAVVVIEFKNGAFGVIEATTCAYPKNLEGSLTILGEKGSVKVGGFAVNKMEVWNFKDQDEKDEEKTNCSTNPPDVYGFGHKEFFKNVIKVLRGEEPPATDGEEGRKSLELIEAIYESVKTKKEIMLPLHRG